MQGCFEKCLFIAKVLSDGPNLGGVHLSLPFSPLPAKPNFAGEEQRYCCPNPPSGDLRTFGHKCRQGKIFTLIYGLSSITYTEYTIDLNFVTKIN